MAERGEPVQATPPLEASLSLPLPLAAAGAEGGTSSPGDGAAAAAVPAAAVAFKARKLSVFRQAGKSLGGQRRVSVAGNPARERNASTTLHFSKAVKEASKVGLHNKETEVVIKRFIGRLSEKCSALFALGGEMADTAASDLGKYKAEEWGRSVKELAADVAGLGADIEHSVRLEQKQTTYSLRMGGVTPTAQQVQQAEQEAADREATASAAAMSLKARAQPAAGTEGVPVPKSIVQTITASMYMVLESVSQAIGAEKSAMYLHNASENILIGSVAYGYGAMRPRDLRCELKDTLVGMCFQAKIGVPTHTGCNFKAADEALSPRGQKGQDSQRVWSSLVLPLVGKNGAALGVLQFVNKCCGKRDFAEDDECIGYRASQILTYLVQQYPCRDLSVHAFDPRPLHADHPLPLPESQEGLRISSFDSVATRKPQLMMTDLEAGGGTRASASGGLVVYDQTGTRAVKTSSNLVEVAEYVKWLEEAWQAAVELNRELQAQFALRTSANRLVTAQMSKKLDAAKKEAVLYKEMLGWRVAASAHPPRKGSLAVPEDNVPSAEADGVIIPVSAARLPTPPSEAAWRLGDVAVLVADAVYLQYLYEADVRKLPAHLRYSDLAGVVATVVGFSEGGLVLRCGARGAVKRGQEVDVPVAAVQSKADAHHHLATLQRKDRTGAVLDAAYNAGDPDAWRLGDIAVLSADPTYVQYCYEVGGQACVPHLAYKDLCGVVGTVVRVHENGLILRCGRHGKVRRGEELDVPLAAVHARTQNDTHLANFLRRRSLQGPNVVPLPPSAYVHEDSESEGDAPAHVPRTASSSLLSTGRPPSRAKGSGGTAAGTAAAATTAAADSIPEAPAQPTAYEPPRLPQKAATGDDFAALPPLPPSEAAGKGGRAASGGWQASRRTSAPRASIGSRRGSRSAL